jgi:hypothetical protein
MTHTPESRRDNNANERTLPPEPKPKLGPEHKHLSVFVGSWRGEGRGGNGGAATVEETYDWVPGEFFLWSRFDQRFGATPHVGAGLIGYDPATKRYFAHLVDNIGYDRIYELRLEGDGVWTYSGARERARMNFNGDTLNVRWEHRPNGGPWEELCAYELTRHRIDKAH